MYRSKDQKQNFWVYQIFGWLIYAVVFYFFFYWRTIEKTSDFIGFSITILTGVLFSSILRVLYRRVHYQNRSIVHLASLVISVSVGSAVVWFWTDSLLSMLAYGFTTVTDFLESQSFLFYVSSHFYYYSIFISWSALYFFIKFWNEWQSQRERTRKANCLAQSAQSQMLRYQLNPHFLFNSLNSIRALIDEDKKNAKTMITELSEFLRHSLLVKDDDYQPLREEIRVIRNYCSLQKRRFQSRLQVCFDIEPAVEEFPVPNLLFHPLVENAIKYGMKTSQMPLQIRIKAKLVNEALHLEVSNSGEWIKTAKGSMRESTGTGLENVYQRLDNVFPNQYDIELKEESGWVCFIIRIYKDARILDAELV